MKQSILLITSFLFTCQLSAQIVVERSDYLLTSAGAEVSSWSMSTAGLSAPEEGADVTWDYSAQALTDPFTYTKDPISGDPSFPEANLVEASSDLLLGLVDVPVVFYERLDDNGFATLGRTSSTVSLPSAPITGGANDTITFLGTTNVYEEPTYYSKFPLTYQNTWQTDITIKSDYLMTVVGFGLDHVPAGQTTYISHDASVVGHGTLILPNPDGSGSVSMAALLLRRDRVKVDSFFLAGQPAPAVMLGALGLVQGATSTRSEYSFYAKGLPRTAMSMSVSNGQVTSASMADDVKGLVSSSRFVAPQLAAIKVFPNPTSGDFQVEFEKTDAQAWTLELYSPLGQIILHEKLQGVSGMTVAKISLPPFTPAGLHYFALRNAEGMIVANGHLAVR